jgi:pyruvate/2-oxoglutarate dehydrogenase complex dihydrolipoamide acyltransferase (E2) component
MSFDVLPFPSVRNPIIDSGYMAARRHIIHGFLQLDVTEARHILKDTHGIDNRPLSFTAYIVASYARAIQQHLQVQAFRDIFGRLVIFHEVDVSTLVEPEPGAVAVPHVICNAQARSVRDISEEIRSVQANPHPWGKQERIMKIGSKMPCFLRLGYMRIYKLNPKAFKKIAGTTIISSIGMFGKRAGWGIGFLAYHAIGLLVGDISEEPIANKGSIALRECLHVTLSFDHDIVDGAPAARFARTFADLVESASLLQDERV